MSKRLVLEIDKATAYAGSPLRANISLLEDDDSGYGHRLFGPKFGGVPGKVLKTCVLDEYDRRALRKMLDEIDADELEGKTRASFPAATYPTDVAQCWHRHPTAGHVCIRPEEPKHTDHWTANNRGWSTAEDEDATR